MLEVKADGFDAAFDAAGLAADVAALRGDVAGLKAQVDGAQQGAERVRRIAWTIGKEEG